MYLWLLTGHKTNAEVDHCAVGGSYERGINLGLAGKCRNVFFFRRFLLFSPALVVYVCTGATLGPPR